MLEFEKREVTETHKYPTYVTCDICGKKYNLESNESEDVFEVQEFIHIKFTGGFGSVFGDGDTVRLDMCQHCFQDKLGKYVAIEE